MFSVTSLRTFVVAAKPPIKKQKLKKTHVRTVAVVVSVTPALLKTTAAYLAAADRAAAAAGH